jgi:uncharacterized protein with beta-barrel porin domain
LCKPPAASGAHHAIGILSAGAILRLAWLVLMVALLPDSAGAQALGLAQGFGQASTQMQMSGPPTGPGPGPSGMPGGGMGFSPGAGSWTPASPQGNAGFNFGGPPNGPPGVFGGPPVGGFGGPPGNAMASGVQQASFEAMTQFLQTVLDPFAGGREVREPSQGALTEDAGKALPHWSVWATGFGESQTSNGGAMPGAGATNSGVYGTVVGADYAVSSRTTIGFALAGGGTYFNSGLSSGRSDLFQAGSFVRHMTGDAYVSAALAYGWQDVAAFGGSDRLNPASLANAYSSRIEAGYRFALPWLGIAPYAAGQVTNVQLPGGGAQVLANPFASGDGTSTVTDSRTEFGFRTDKSVATQIGTLTLRGRFAWVHDFNPDRSTLTMLQMPPGPAFALNGALQAPDAALATASAELRLSAGWLAALTLQSELSSTARSYAGKGFVRYVW